MSAFKDLANLNWGDWLRTLLGAGISAGASAIAANPIAIVMGAQQFTPRQLGIMALSSAIVAMAGILKQSPLPSRTLAIALLPGVHTEEQVREVEKVTASGQVPTPAAAKAIIASMDKIPSPEERRG